MSEDWKQAQEALRQMTVTGSENNEPVVISGYAEGVRCVGIGTDAAVFTYDQTPGYAFKVFTEQAKDKIPVELSVYERLKGSSFFPTCYGHDANYLVLSYEAGPTLQDCLLQGIEVPKQVITDVEAARKYVRGVGLNPRDIHLKNVIMQNGRAKVIDVSEYVHEGDDRRWDHLVWAYEQFYDRIAGKTIPSWVLDTIKNWYARIGTMNNTLNVEELAKRAGDLFSKYMK
ncbi:serine/threonine protein kinase [Paenibacillus hunanensis]|uniref:serine/threonine protein kinase n=1 Tax=Paenibacillus hunanensis TaxID=539262 RepID=UPI002A6B5A06|nr:serine/threonine protein kinase [Paenibacillus hunanensis]WPP39410.1 serine/threonine protein kinase [Paenibacillus hunanensis]